MAREIPQKLKDLIVSFLAYERNFGQLTFICSELQPAEVDEHRHVPPNYYVLERLRAHVC